MFFKENRMAFSNKCLIVDTDYMYAKELKDAISNCNYLGKKIESLVADNLEEALHLMSWDKFDLIIFDFSSFGDEGINTYNLIHKESKATPIIAIFNTENDKFAESLFSEGAHDIIVKDEININGIKRAVKNAFYRIDQAGTHKSVRPGSGAQSTKVLASIQYSIELLLNETAGPLNEDQKIALNMIKTNFDKINHSH